MFVCCGTTSQMSWKRVWNRGDGLVELAMHEIFDSFHGYCVGLLDFVKQADDQR